MKIKFFRTLPVSRQMALLFPVMRAFIFLFCTTIFALSPNKGLSQNVWIHVDSDKEATLKEVFKMIRNQTDYTFVYNEKHLANAPKIRLTKGSVDAESLLKKGLYPINCTYEVLEKTIIVRKNDLKPLVQETFTLKGVVVDEGGVPVAGATVYVSDVAPGQTEKQKDFFVRGTSADFDGSFKLEVAMNQWLVVSAVGFKYYSKQILSKQELRIALKEYASELEEVVIVGYGTQKRKEVSSAISSVKKEKVVSNLGNNTSFDRGLSGLIKGVQVTQGSGQPGSSVDINIRGVTSPFAGGDNNPLFVIDGVPFQVNPTFSFEGGNSISEIPNPLLAINPNDIESIDVLKDASATAIYGSRGANGVIIVNTKRGKKGERMNVTLSATSTFAKPIGKPKYLNTAQYKARAEQILQNSVAFANTNPAGLSPFSLTSFAHIANIPIDFSTSTATYEGLNQDWFGDADTNWVDLAYRDPAYTQQYNLSISGGSRNTSYGVSMGYTDQEGLLLEDELKQYNFRTNLDVRVSDVVSAGFNLNMSFADNQTGYNGQNSDLASIGLSARPDIAPFDEVGNFNRLPGKLFGFFDTQAANPLALTTGHDNTTETFSVLGNAYVEFRMFEGFKLKGDVNVGRFANDVNNFTPNSIVGNITPDFGQLGTAAASSLSVTSATNTSLISNLTADYSRSFGEKHNLNALAGFAWDRSYAERSNAFYQNFPDDQTLTNATVAGSVLAYGDDKIETGLNSIFSRLSYNFDEKYFLTLNFRTDRSAKFGPGNQRGYFPSVAASWDIAKENFLKESKTVNHLRFRVGYGRTGSNNIEDFAYRQFWSVGTRNARLYNGNIAVGLSGTLPNTNIKWETTDEINLGLDFAFLGSRIRGSVDVYDRDTSGALIAGIFPLESGASSFTQNFADLTNKGFEVDLSGDIIRARNLNWSLGLNLAKNTNTLDRFSEDALSPFVRRFYEVGREVNIIRGYVADGYFQTQEEVDALNSAAPDGFYQNRGTAPGDYKYVDLDGDGEITTEDQQYLGSAQPELFGGFNTLVSYKAFDLAANFNFSLGGEATLFADGNGLGGDPTINVETRYLDTWTPENPNARYPRTVINGFRVNNNDRRSTALLYDTSYLRLQSLQLRFRFPDQILEHMGLNSASLALTGNNLWTVSDFPGIDPASIGGFASPGSGATRDPYPIAKSWSLGLNINF